MPGLAVTPPPLLLILLPPPPPGSFIAVCTVTSGVRSYEQMAVVAVAATQWYRLDCECDRTVSVAVADWAMGVGDVADGC